ncbi:MAG: hypothetical protein LBI53_08245 [Candidatus Peribacteria bacterium]|jgi:hypothetical protein|nr:hypothetical protein [Candidatus Peribacteria bacterium]
MDLSNFQLKLPKMQGFDYEIIATTNLQFSFSSIYDFLDNITSTINKISTATTTMASDAIKK